MVMWPNLLLLLLLCATVVSPAQAQGRTAVDELDRFFEARGIAFITAREDNVRYLTGIPRIVSGDGACWDPEPSPGDPYALRADLNDDAKPDAVEIGLRDSSVVVVACLTTAAQGVYCHENVVADNQPFRIRPRCAYEEAEFAGYNRFRLSEVRADDRAFWEDTTLPVFLLEEGMGARYFCALPDELRVCGWVN